MKYVLVSGGVISGVGKGIIVLKADIHPLLSLVHRPATQIQWVEDNFIKIDPYLNVDAGTMNPREHGEVFVLDDGGEADLDLGNYERYLDIRLTRDNNITTGKIYQHVIEAERTGKYLGKTVQVVPHVTGAIVEWIERVARIPADGSDQEPDVCVIELGGTIGDIENMVYFEALASLRKKVGRTNFAQIHVSYVMEIHGEQKSRPTQHSIRDIAAAGHIPDLVACRCVNTLNPSVVQKIADASGICPDQVMGVIDVPSIYMVPSLLKRQGMDTTLMDHLQLNLESVPASLREIGFNGWSRWNELACPPMDTPRPDVTIALVGKYVEANDAYLSVIKALEHSSMRCNRTLKINWVDSSLLEEETKSTSPEEYARGWDLVRSANGVLVPGGFGHRGTEGMVAAARYARETNVPYLGVCLGMQVAVIDYARNVCGMKDATSEEFASEKPVSAEAERAIIFMPEIDKKTMGGNMRLGARATLFQPESEWSKIRTMYGGVDSVLERHRHRYEINPKLVPQLEERNDLIFVGKDEFNERMEILELRNHPWYVAVQYHPEYLSRVLRPSVPYLGLVAASAGCLDEILKAQSADSNK